MIAHEEREAAIRDFVLSNDGDLLIIKWNPLNHTDAMFAFIFAAKLCKYGLVDSISMNEIVMKRTKL